MFRRFTIDPRQVRAGDFPKDGKTRERLLFLLRYAVLAPSFRNLQPWKFAVDAERIGFFADRSRWLVASDPAGRDLRMSVGCALENLVCAARHFGYDPRVAYFPRRASPDFLAVVDLSRKAPRQRGDPPIEVLQRRSTARQTHPHRPLAPDVFEDLERACGDDDTWLILTTEAKACKAAARLFKRASDSQLADQGVREEIAHWLPDVEYDVPSWAARFSVLALPRIAKSVAMEARRIEDAPCFAVLVSREDSALAHVRAGRAFERVWLAAANHHVALRPASAMCAVPAVRTQLERLMEVPPGLHAQMAFRLGPSDAAGPRTARRRVDKRMFAAG